MWRRWTSAASRRRPPRSSGNTPRCVLHRERQRRLQRRTREGLSRTAFFACPDTCTQRAQRGLLLEGIVFMNAEPGADTIRAIGKTSRQRRGGQSSNTYGTRSPKTYKPVLDDTKYRRLHRGVAGRIHRARGEAPDAVRLACDGPRPGGEPRPRRARTQVRREKRQGN